MDAIEYNAVANKLASISRDVQNALGKFTTKTPIKRLIAPDSNVHCAHDRAPMYCTQNSLNITSYPMGKMTMPIDKGVKADYASAKKASLTGLASAKVEIRITLEKLKFIDDTINNKNDLPAEEFLSLKTQQEKLNLHLEFLYEIRGSINQQIAGLRNGYRVNRSGTKHDKFQEIAYKKIVINRKIRKLEILKSAKLKIAQKIASVQYTTAKAIRSSEERRIDNLAQSISNRIQLGNIYVFAYVPKDGTINFVKSNTNGIKADYFKTIKPAFKAVSMTDILPETKRAYDSFVKKLQSIMSESIVALGNNLYMTISTDMPENLELNNAIPIYSIA